ncbi:MAG: phosphatidate cytidylyltransferase [Ignavibacteria bacterium]|nr:phosphatidate cytidylyltransferase [Ignavibacteria bacterium]
MSNLLKRILVSIIAIPVLILLIYLGGFYFLALCILIQSLCLYEFFSLFDKSGYKPFKFFPVILSVAVFFMIFFEYPHALLVSVVFLLIILSSEIFRTAGRNPVNVFINVSGFIYITVPFLILFKLDSEYRFVIYLMMMIWMNDIAAYFTGKYFGRHKLTSISPNKTVEGSVAGIIFTILISIVFFIFNRDLINISDAVVLGVLTATAGQAGDIFESLLKRYNNVKDSSSIIPGHGGVLDRFDSLIFSAPLMYVYINIFK